MSFSMSYAISGFFRKQNQTSIQWEESSLKILFLCVANSARSQMAEGLARNLFGSKADITSAGSEPSKVNPFAIKAMKKIGIDITTHYSKPIAKALTSDIELVVTLCAEEVCPIVPGSTKKEHWPFQDPAGVKGTDEAILASFEQIRNQIREKLIQFGKAHNLVEANLSH